MEAMGGGGTQPIVTTLDAIVNGIFTSAVDKQGDGRSYVEVRDVVVFKVITEEADGDWHVYMRDPTYDHIIGEVIPRDHAAVGEPPLGVPLVVRGIAYCDTEHEYDAWHCDTNSLLPSRSCYPPDNDLAANHYSLNVHPPGPIHKRVHDVNAGVCVRPQEIV